MSVAYAYRAYLYMHTLTICHDVGRSSLVCFTVICISRHCRRLYVQLCPSLLPLQRTRKCYKIS